MDQGRTLSVPGSPQDIRQGMEESAVACKDSLEHLGPKSCAEVLCQAGEKAVDHGTIPGDPRHDQSQDYDGKRL